MQAYFFPNGRSERSMSSRNSSASSTAAVPTESWELQLWGPRRVERGGRFRRETLSFGTRVFGLDHRLVSDRLRMRHGTVRRLRTLGPQREDDPVGLAG